MKPKTFKEFLVLVAIAVGILLSVIGFALFVTDRGSAIIFESIGITVALLLGILFWFGLGLAGLLRVLGIALITSGVVCMMRKPFAGIVCLLIGIGCRLAAFWMTRHIYQRGSRSESAATKLSILNFTTKIKK